MTVLQIFLYSCLIGLILGREEKDIKESFIEIAMDCTKDHPVSAEEFQMLKNHKIPQNNNVKCLLACTFKKINWIDSKGMFDDAVAYKMSEIDYVNQPEKIKGARVLYDECKKVNDAPVSDGESGCDRAVILASCLMKNYEKMGFVL